MNSSASSPTGPRFWRRRAVALLASLAVLLGVFPGGAPAAAVELDQQDLQAQALASLNESYRRLSDGTYSPRASFVANVALGGKVDSVAERIARIDVRRQINAQYGLAFTSVDVTLKNVSVERSPARVVLRAIEAAWLYYEVDNRGARRDDVMGEETPHEFVFEPINGVWTLVFDRTLRPASEPPQHDPDAPRIDPTRALTHQRPEMRGGGRPSTPRPRAAWGTFNTAAAVNYATTWWNGHNTFYPHYGINDCANFMSQVKAAGGWTAKGGFYLDGNAWWYDGGNHTNTWSLANWLLGFATNSGRGYYLGSFSDLQVGDFMYADWAWKNGITNTPEHSMIVSQRFSSSYADIKLTYHSEDRLHKPLSDIMAENPGSVYWGTRVPYTSN